MVAITKTIWGGYISNYFPLDEMGLQDTLKYGANQSIGEAEGPVSNTDIARAASPHTGSARIISTSITDNTNAITLIGDEIDGSDLIALLEQFMLIYTKVRTYTFHEAYEDFQEGNNSTPTADYKKRGFEAGLPTVAGTDSPGPSNTVYNAIRGDETVGSEDVVDLSDYKAVIQNLIDNWIEIRANVDDASDIIYCHNSCHDNCHYSRGRR